MQTCSGFSPCLKKTLAPHLIEMCTFRNIQKIQPGFTEREEGKK